MMGNTHITITRILIITLVGVTSLIMTTFGMIDYYYDYNRRIGSLNSKLDSIAAQLSVAVINPMWTFNIKDIGNIIESFMKDQEVSVVFVEDEKRLIGRKQDENGNILPLQNRLFSKGNFYTENKIFFKGEHIGVIGVCLTDKFVKKELKISLFYLLSSYVALNFSLVCISFFVLMKVVFTPLKKIEEYAVRMSNYSGVEDTSIEGHGFARELVNLKDSIENMIDQLKSRYLELKQSQCTLKETEKKYREIFNNAAEGIFQITQDGRLLTANPSLAKIMGFESTEDILKSVTNVAIDFYVEPSKRDELLNILNIRKRVQNFETEFFRKDKSVILVSITAHSVFDENNNIIYHEGMIEDITQRRIAEELKIAKEAAEATTRAKSVFLASMSHEIRTPMSAIIGLTDLASTTELTEKQQDYLEKIGSSANDLLGIISDILDFSKIEAGELNMEYLAFSMDYIRVSISDIFEQKSVDKGVQFNFFLEEGVPSVLLGDPLRIKQILINLIGNALKFTEKGEIIVRIGVEMKSSDRVTLKFSVKDTGVGIRQEKLSSIFSPFTQVEPFIDRRYGGTGLGLSICKQLVEMMDGDIWVESEPGHGACFIFTARFGLQQGDQVTECARPEKKINMIVNKEELKGVRILIVEDNSINRQVATEILESQGLLVVSAINGLEAVNMFSSMKDDGQFNFDAVLMDVQMPVMNGFEATRLIRKREAQNLEAGESGADEIPIIAMTAHAMMGDREKCLESGMNDYITKPIEPNRLLGTLKKWIFPESGMYHATGDDDEDIAKTRIEVEDNDNELFDFFGVKCLPGITLSRGLKRLKGNKTLYLNLLSEFIQNHSGDVQKIKQAVENEDMQLAQILVHTFKGVVKSIAADHLAEIAEKMEGEIKQGVAVKKSSFREAQMMISEIAESIHRIKNLPNVGYEESSSEKLSLNIVEITPVVIEMYELLKNNRIDADKYSGSLKAFLIHSGFKTLASEFDTCLGQFDFKGARTTMEKIARKLNISLEKRDIC